MHNPREEEFMAISLEMYVLVCCPSRVICALPNELQFCLQNENVRETGYH